MFYTENNMRRKRHLKPSKNTARTEGGTCIVALSVFRARIFKL